MFPCDGKVSLAPVLRSPIALKPPAPGSPSRQTQLRTDNAILVLDPHNRQPGLRMRLIAPSLVAFPPLITTCSKYAESKLRQSNAAGPHVVPWLQAVLSQVNKFVLPVVEPANLTTGPLAGTACTTFEPLTVVGAKAASLADTVQPVSVVVPPPPV